MVQTVKRFVIVGACIAFAGIALGADAPVAPTPIAPLPKAALQSLTVFPAKIDLDGPRAEQWLGVFGEYADGSRRDLRRTAQFTLAEALGEMDAQGVLHPRKDGETTLTVSVGGKTANAPVRIRNATADVPVDFSREVVPVLTRTGCNQGACHGTSHGRGGFKLSLLGFDPLFDYTQIVSTAEGRRIVPSDPERSTLLLKPTLTLEHGGGERFTIGSREYEVIRRWLEDGVPAPKGKTGHVTGLSVWPTRRLMVPGEQQQIIATAVWSDGRTEDVTAVAQFNALNDAVATVTPQGLLTATGKGESFIMVRFAGQATVAQVTLPFGPENPLDFSANNYIDEKLIAKWRELGLAPSALCSDEEFIRRVYLDAIGTLPNPAEARAYLADRSADKRVKLIDRVLERPEFVDFWALKWGDLLRINRLQLGDKGMWAYHNWVRACLRDNKPVDAMVRDILTAEGSTSSSGPANFFRTVSGPADWSEMATQVFLGVRLQCARCHHHPFEKWSQDDYNGMSAFFGRLGTKNSAEFGLFGGAETVVFLRDGGGVKAHPLDGPDMSDPLDPRRALANWMTTPENLMFSRNMVNRFWSYTMGRGLVEPVDDMRATNPPSNPDLLDALASDFAANKFNLKHLLKTIFSSRAYQLSSLPAPGNQTDAANVFHARYTRKRLSAEQVADAIDEVTGTREKYTGLPLGTRAIQLPDARVPSYLLTVFGRPPRQITCECERTTQPNIAQALHLLNSDFLNRKIDAPTGRVAKLLSAKTPAPKLIEELYLCTLSRPPQPDELARAQNWLKEAKTPTEGAADLLWVLLNSREFLFNH